jgi:hypothetical protein
MTKQTVPIDDRVGIGHVHLKVADLERALKFYCGVLGFELQQRFGSSRVHFGGRLSSSHRLEHMGKRGRFRRRRPAAPGFIIWRSCIRRARCWRMRCGDCLRRALNWMALRITA